MKQSTRKQTEIFWPRIVLKKWLNISAHESNFNADPDEGDSGSDSDNEGFDEWGRELHSREKKRDDFQFENNETESIPKLRRRNSETLRAQYINTKELRICVGTWNVGGKLPPEDLNIEGWLDMNEHADIYVIGLQEIVPLNAGNIFGAEDSRPVLKWENIIRATLNRVKPLERFKSYSDPPSPSRFKPTDDFPDIEDEILHETDSDSDGDGDGDDVEIHPSRNESNGFDEVKEDGPTSASICTSNVNFDASREQDFQRQFSSPKRLDRLNCLRMEEESKENSEASFAQQKSKITKILSGSEMIGLSWPEPPLNFQAPRPLEKSFKSVKSLRAFNSFRTYNSLKSLMNVDNKGSEDLAMLTEIDLDSVIYRKRKSAFVRIVSKQMVGICLSIWVRRNLRRHIHNLKVSTVGVGVMGYIGNKGSISVSMSIYQTLFCFICTHLTSGEKDGDELRRNADVQEIHRRTQFRSISGNRFPQTIHDHERIIWLGDLNYRINLTYEKTKELISKKEWNKLVEKDQLVRELRKGRAFDGWKEGVLNFPPTYKYELNSQKYYGEDPKVGRRTPAWCDRILSYGKGLKLLNYRRIEEIFSDHRPVTAIYMAEVEIFCHRKLQKALTFTDAELENGEVLHDLDFDVGINRLRFGEICILPLM